MDNSLALRLRPKTIDDVIGQEHLLSQNGIIRRMVDADRLESIILYGPPGIGKTSIASAIAGSTQREFNIFNAATDPKALLQKVAKKSEKNQQILLLDEIHRLDRPKQDYLLPFMENNKIIVIGATTENPYINIAPAIRSRSRIFELQPLTDKQIETALEKALKTDVVLSQINFQIENNALSTLARNTHGDLRTAYNALDLIAMSNHAHQNDTITTNDLLSVLDMQQSQFDKNGDGHYNLISAFQKSIRGSDTNAALYYLALLLKSGDLPIIIRRLTVIAYEDIGSADWQTATNAVIAITQAEKLGQKEARIPLANAVVMLCLAPKSNTMIKAIDSALSITEKQTNINIPRNLRDAHYKGAKALGNGTTYKYAHDYPYHVTNQQYLPTDILNAKFVDFDMNNKTEQELARRYHNLDAIIHKP